MKPCPTAALLRTGLACQYNACKGIAIIVTILAARQSNTGIRSLVDASTFAALEYCTFRG